MPYDFFNFPNHLLDAVVVKNHRCSSVFLISKASSNICPSGCLATLFETCVSTSFILWNWPFLFLVKFPLKRSCSWRIDASFLIVLAAVVFPVQNWFASSLQLCLVLWASRSLLFSSMVSVFLPARTGDRHGYAENTARIVEKQHCTLTLASKLMNIRNWEIRSLHKSAFETWDLLT